MITRVGKVTNADVNVKNWLIRVSMIMDLFIILVCVNVIDKSCDVGEYLYCASCRCRKRLIDKLVLECEYEILNAFHWIQQILFQLLIKKVSCKNNCLVYIISMAINCFYQLLLLLHKILVKKEILNIFVLMFKC